MVEVYKTNVTKRKQSEQILEKLNERFPKYKINFDLEDCDNILRIENPIDFVDNELVIKLIRDIGYYVQPLPDTY